MIKLFITLLTALSVGSVIFICYAAWIINQAFVKVMELGFIK
jgi:hypothetical protein